MPECLDFSLTVSILPLCTFLPPKLCATAMFDDDAYFLLRFIEMGITAPVIIKKMLDTFHVKRHAKQQEVPFV